MKIMQRPFIKIKRLSRHRKKKLRVDPSETRTYLLRRRKREKTLVAPETIVAINLKALKIIADPKIDVDYVRIMSTVSLYGRNYRNPAKADTAEGTTLHIRPDVTQKLSDMEIGDESEEERDANAAQQEIETDVLRRTSCLRINDNSEPSLNDRLKNIFVSENASRASETSLKIRREPSTNVGDT